MPRTDRACRVVAASPARVYRAFTERDELATWLPPEGMTAVFERFDMRPGGSYRLVEVVADDVPDGISPEDHAAGMASSLSKLADHLAR